MPEFFRRHQGIFALLCICLGYATLKLLALNSGWTIAPMLVLIGLAKKVDDMSPKDRAMRAANEPENRRNRRIR